VSAQSSSRCAAWKGVLTSSPEVHVLLEGAQCGHRIRRGVPLLLGAAPLLHALGLGRALHLAQLALVLAFHPASE
jgi:hypothetical protein